MSARSCRVIRILFALLLPMVAAGCGEPDETGEVADAARDATRGRQDMFQPPPDMQPFDLAVVPPPRDAGQPDAAELDMAPPPPDQGPPPADMALPPPDMAAPPPDMGAPDMGCAAREICHNGIDDDCNGVVDDPLVCDQELPPCVADAPCFTGQVGVCAVGTSRCPNGPEGEAVCDPLEQPAAEICDGELDEDCDGNVDEGFGLDEPCEAGVGACRALGVFQCGPDGGARCTAAPRGPRLERCDGGAPADEDCDGTVDEGFEDLGQPCQVGLGICEAAGEVICAANGVSTRCSARPAGPGSELCNQADDDCDGETDELFPELGEACVLGLGACRAEGVRVCFSENRTYCNAQPGLPDVESCNATDDDCDGNTDEGPDGRPLTVACYGGPDGTAGVGLCRQGRRACGAQGLGACEGEVGPAEEVCDGSDNDCDGRVDEGADGGPIRLPCYAGPAGTAGVGACRQGNRTCRNGALSLCEGQVQPRVEICDSLDNDCNGQVDDVAVGGCDCVPLVRRPCYSGPDGTEGVGRCRAGNQNCRADGTGYGECFDEFTPTAEACNGEDDDCDGRTDEEIDGIGAACNVGLGACGAVGVFLCDPARGPRCSVNPGEPDPEVCDGVDNDCDGATDEQFRLGLVCRLGIGACVRQGEVVCSPDGSTSQCSVQPGEPEAERCDGLDNDCDGRSDEGLNLGLPCEVGQGACLARGVRVCGNNGVVTCSVAPGAPQAERCDSRDNDCDGTTDEGYAVGDACTAGQGICARDGLRQCSAAGGVECSAVAAPPGVEACDARDNDCDGRTDEDFALGVACAAGVGQCRANGQTICAANGAGTTCGAQPGAPAAEICDGLDNDCDGRSDEDFDLGSACTNGVGACATPGVTRCQGGVARCDAVPGAPRAETCDGTDQDCDGRTDEGFPVGERCEAGDGACLEVGVTRCLANGQIECSARAHDPEPELCDSRDNDCDGRTDEGFALGQACSRGQGICLRDGMTRCGQNGQLECSALPGVGRAETCDGRDEDCDGRTDEGFPVGQACEAGVGECFRSGMLQCAIGGGTQCSVQAGAPRAERCDAIDNDCDGRSDEGLNLGAACIAGAGQCEAEGTLACGAGGAVICAAEQPMGEAEACDDLDNDCDGRVDEGGVCPDLEPPQVTLLLEPVFVLFNGLARVTVTVTDDQDPDPEVTATIDGAPIPLDANGQYLYQANEAGAHEVVAVAVDAAGRRGEARDYFRVQNLDDNEPPVVRIIAPADTSELNGVTEIHGRLEDPNFFSWKLEISFDQQNWQVINTGMTSGPDVVVGSIDPTVMPPGFVYVRLTGEDENSLNQFQIVTYLVPDGVSLGETKIGIRDFEMPVKGFSLAFDREYDSRRKFLDGDFGFGWKLTATRVEVREDLQSNVMVALPDGRREVFAIAYNFPGFFPFGTMSYVAPAGVYSTLTSPQACAVANTAQGVVCFDTGRPPAFSVANYVLTTQDGTRYEIHDQRGLDRLTDREGNQFTFARDRITSNVGVEITMARDAAGRITSMTDPRGGIIEYRYDAAGNLTEVEDQAGGVQTYVYDGDHGLLRVLGPDGNPVIRTEYDEEGRKVRDVDALGNETLYDYDFDNRIQTVTNRRGDVIVYEYSELGQILSRLDEMGNEATFEYNALEQLAAETLPDGARFSYVYDARGNQTRVTLPTGEANAFAYDAFGQPITMTDPAGHVNRMTYDASGRLTSIQNGAGNTLTLEYDANGNRQAVVEPDGQRTTYAYDALGNITTMQRDGGFTRTYAYNAASQMTRLVDSDGNSMDLDYDAVGRLQRVVDPLGGEIIAERDGLGRITRLTDADQSVRRYTFDPRGLLATITDPNGAETAYDYDAEGALVGLTYPDGAQVQLTRDAGGRITARRDPLGNVARFTLDAMGRVIGRTDRNGDVIVYEYNTLGDMVRRSDADGETTYEYDTVGRLTRVVGIDDVIVYEYDEDDRLVVEEPLAGLRLEHTWDAAARRASTTGPEGVSTFDYDAGGRLSSLQDPVLGPIDFVRNPEGRLTGIRYANGVAIDYTYDAMGRPTRWQARAAGGAVVAGETWTFDAVGRPTRVDREDGRRFDLTYDAAGQITRSVLRTNGVVTRDVAYTYDARGGMTGRTVNGQVAAHQLDADQRLQRDGTWSYRYDAAGNVVERTRLDGSGREVFTYDAERYLTSFTRFDAGGAVTAQVGYRYNGQGERSARIEGGVETQFATSFGERGWVRSPAGQTLQRFVYGDQTDQVLALDQPDGPVYFALDGRGSVAAAFDEAGQLVGRYLYDDFGALLDQAGPFTSPLGFEGRPRDPTTGLYDFRARSYDPAAGRFLQQDPESGSLQRPRTQHPYLYGANSPWFYRDPNGRAAAISYAFLSSRFVTGSGNVNTPSHGELLGAFIGFMHGFSAGAFVFLANILDLSGSGQDIKTIWGIATANTKTKLDEIAGLLGRGAALDDSGFAGAFVNGAKFQVGFKFSLKLPKPVSKGIAVAGGKTSQGVWAIEKSGGGFKEGNKQFLNFLEQVGPQ